MVITVVRCRNGLGFLYISKFWIFYVFGFSNIYMRVSQEKNETVTLGYTAKSPNMDPPLCSLR